MRKGEAFMGKARIYECHVCRTEVERRVKVPRAICRRCHLERNRAWARLYKLKLKKKKNAKTRGVPHGVRKQK